MSLGAAFLSLLIAVASFVGAILAGALLAVAVVAAMVAVCFGPLILKLWIEARISERACRRHQKWFDGLCQGEPPK